MGALSMSRGRSSGSPAQADSSTAVGLWTQRLPAKNVYYYRCPDHRRNYVMSFAFCFDLEDDVYQFAYCYPYTYSRLQHYLAGLERRNLPYLQREQLGLSVVSWEVGRWGGAFGQVEEKREGGVVAMAGAGNSNVGGVCPGVCGGSSLSFPSAGPAEEARSMTLLVTSDTAQPLPADQMERKCKWETSGWESGQATHQP
ncbi:Cytosolic carboxypeptidase 6 [Liparis tanakae]|uniref:Cytosolic carboxypeptidase 6 n=1 Tax=Liparis tanakae TaxID=230148 RepID=A0A4Z2IDI6_9TELE|nr:Cytosolic carboxypeptidase 6 [Liparis tanakae]